jgi:hypothetical protein
MAIIVTTVDDDFFFFQDQAENVSCVCTIGRHMKWSGSILVSNIWICYRVYMRKLARCTSTATSASSSPRRSSPRDLVSFEGSTDGVVRMWSLDYVQGIQHTAIFPWNFSILMF